MIITSFEEEEEPMVAKPDKPKVPTPKDSDDDDDVEDDDEDEDKLRLVVPKDEEEDAILVGTLKSFVWVCFVALTKRGSVFQFRQHTHPLPGNNMPQWARQAFSG